MVRVVTGDGRLVVDDAVLEGLDHGPDARQRRSQVVRHPRHQVPPALLGGRRLGLGLRQPGRRGRQLGGQRPQLARRRAAGTSSAPSPRRKASSPIDRLASATRRPSRRAVATATVPAPTSTTHNTRKSCSIRNMSELAQMTPMATARMGASAATAVCTAMPTAAQGPQQHHRHHGRNPRPNHGVDQQADGVVGGDAAGHRHR